MGADTRLFAPLPRWNATTLPFATGAPKTYTAVLTNVQLPMSCIPQAFELSTAKCKSVDVLNAVCRCRHPSRPGPILVPARASKPIGLLSGGIEVHKGMGMLGARCSRCGGRNPPLGAYPQGV